MFNRLSNSRYGIPFEGGWKKKREKEKKKKKQLVSTWKSRESCKEIPMIIRFESLFLLCFSPSFSHSPLFAPFLSSISSIPSFPSVRFEGERRRERRRRRHAYIVPRINLLNTKIRKGRKRTDRARPSRLAYR